MHNNGKDNAKVDKCQDECAIPARLLTVKEVAERLGCSPANIYALIEQGLLPVVRIGPTRGFRIDPADLNAFIQNRKTQNAGAKPKAPRPRLKHIKL